MDKAKEERIKQLQKVVCICKGIKLKTVLPGIQKGSTVEEVNKLTGCGTGGCRGARCGPRVKALLDKKNEQTIQKSESKSKSSNSSSKDQQDEY